MWINTATGETFSSHSDIRSKFPGTSLPSNLTDEALGLIGFSPVDIVVPVYDPVTQYATETTPVLTAKGHWEQAWTITDKTPEVIAAEAASAILTARTALLKQIDADTDAIYLAVQGYRGPEYMLAETDATAYKDAGYTGTVPSSVQSWATAKSQTAQWAADDILATAAAWRTAQASIRAQRLARKEQARTAADLAPVATGWAGFVAAIRAALGVVS